ncbi:5-formyltetrahydrofolate cyclo-ligase [Paenibacillus sp. GCM10027627]|uniref:5-formyltetrahydrofolate cyclo-ligase n=1 Tax=unclassified Paenibacillus TaxID=185978 RepID=UPI003630330B
MSAHQEGLDKAAFRSQMAGRRNGICSELRKEWSEAAGMRLTKWMQSRDYRSVMVYISFRSELDLSSFIEWCWEQGIEVIVPRCIPADRTMELYRLADWDELEAGSYGILEPDPNRAKRLQQTVWPDVIVVPGLAYDLQGGRLGYGGGYYDRFADAAVEAIGKLSKEKRKKPIWLGAGYEAQLVERVPLEAHDLQLNGIVTEKEVYEPVPLRLQGSGGDE